MVSPFYISNYNNCISYSYCNVSKLSHRVNSFYRIKYQSVPSQIATPDSFYSFKYPDEVSAASKYCHTVFHCRKICCIMWADQEQTGAGMDTQRLKYFVAVAEYSSFSDAASNLGISQSAISQQIAELEKQVNTQLIIRKKRPLQLTSAGKVLLKEAYALIAKADDALNKTYQASKGYVGFLKVGFLGGIERGFLPQAVREFRETYQNIDLTLHQYNWGELNKALVREEIDVGFTMTYGFDRFPQLASKDLFKDVTSVAMQRNHRLASESKIKLANLAEESFVTLDPRTDFLLYDQTLQLCGESGFAPKKITLCWDIDVVLFNVESGLGVTILPGTVRDLAGHDVRFIGIDHKDKYFSVKVAWNKSSLNPSIAVFVDKLESLRSIKSIGVNSSQTKK